MENQKPFTAAADGMMSDQPSSGPSSFAALAAAFIPTAVIAALNIAAFILVRRRFPKIYFPRTFIGTIPEKDRTPCRNRSAGHWDWLYTMRTVPDKFILHHVSLDSYLFLRFMRILIFICIAGVAITWPVLGPVNWIGGGSAKELDRVSIGNVTKAELLYVHAFVAWVFFSFVVFTVARERLWLIGLRQAWHLSKTNATRLSSRTVLYLAAPTAALDERNMHRFFGKDAVRIWPATKSDDLQSLVDARNALVEDLESAEMTLIQNINKEVQKHQNPNIKYENLPKQMKKSLRPTHKADKPMIGREVDSIEYYRNEIKEKEDEILKAREANDNIGGHKGAAAVFVEFHSQVAAQQACQQITSSDVLSLTPRYTGVKPNEVIWKNLNLQPARRISQDGLAIVLVTSAILFWSIPVSLVGALSNIEYLAENIKELAFLNRLPPSIMSLLSGLIPPILLSELARYVPKIFRNIFTACGDPTKTAVELRVLKWFFVFQVLQVFLVTTLSSGAAAVTSQILLNPGSVPQLLAERLPLASNTYLTYFVVQALSNAPSNILNYSDVLWYVFYDRVLDNTPRKKYNSYVDLEGMAWGKLFPKYGNFVIIAIAYSCIAPLVLGFAAIGLIIFYWSFRYQFLFTNAPKIDTKGHAYTLALQQLLTGVYIAELCLFGLFSLRGATGPGFLVIALFFATAVVNYTTNQYFAPLETFLPTALTLDSSNDADEADANANEADANEAAPLLSAAEQDESTALESANAHIRHLSARTGLGPSIITPIAQFLQPHVFATSTAMKHWLRDESNRDTDNDDDDAEPQYNDQDVRKAYANPAFTSATPVVWLARDEVGVSKHEARENEDMGLKCTDRGAWLDGEGGVRWSVEDFAEVPVFTGKRGVEW